LEAFFSTLDFLHNKFKDLSLTRCLLYAKLKNHTGAFVFHGIVSATELAFDNHTEAKFLSEKTYCQSTGFLSQYTL